MAGTQPDITFFLDISAEEGIKRAEHRNKLDRLEKESLDFHRTVYEGYMELAKIYPGRFVIIDASGSIEDVFEDIKGRFEEYAKDHEEQ